jgi:hypothetical protein
LLDTVTRIPARFVEPAGAGAEMSNQTTAGRLLESIHAESPAVCDAVTAAAGLSAERANAARAGSSRLSLSEQLRLSEAVATIAPDFAAQALRLRGMVLSARSIDASERIQRDLFDDPWERGAQVHG